MADKKLKKIEETNKKWNCGGMNSEDAIKEIEKILSEKDCDGGSECQCPVTEGRKRSCHNAGPMTINPFFNFMKELRENTCFNATATEIAQEGGAKWRAMSHCDKAPYIVQAYNVSQKKGDISMKRKNSNTSMSSTKSKVRRTE